MVARLRAIECVHAFKIYYSVDVDSLPSAAGLGGVIACCAVLELLGGAAVLGGLAATFGLATGITHLAVAGLAGLLTGLLAYTYRSYQSMSV